MSADIAGLKALLRGRARELLVELFGEPDRETPHELRWGDSGRRSYSFRRGIFRDFSEDKGTDLLGAIQYARGCDFGAALEYARRFLGDDADRPRPRPAPARQATEIDDEDAIGAAEALALWRAGRRIEGTAAALYLQRRGITKWPEDAVRLVGARDVGRFLTKLDDKGRRKPWSWWRWPALVFPLTDAMGAVRSVQLIALNDDGTAVLDRDGKKRKRTRGPMAGCVVRLPGDPAGPLALAEGGETALSIWLETGLETWAVLGGVARAPLDGIDGDRTIVVARDDDARSAPKKDGSGVDVRFSTPLKKVKDAVRKWRREGRRVVEVQPWDLSRGDKSDFNDLLLAEGPDAVRARIHAALVPVDVKSGMALDAARAQLGAAVRDTLAKLIAAPDGTAPHALVVATPGTGKSHVTLSELVAHAEAGISSVYAVPTHEKAEEVVSDLRGLAEKRGSQVRVAVWRGRKRPGMCADLPAVELAQAARVSVVETVCASCEHKTACPYLEQTHQPAEIWVVPHSLLFSDRPSNLEAARLLVVDEGIALAGIGEHKIKPDDLGAPAEMGQRRRRRHKLGSQPASWRESLSMAGLTADIRAELEPLHNALLSVLERHPASRVGEFLRREALVEAGVTVEKARQAADANRARHMDPGSASTRDELEDALRAVAPVNALAKRLALLWKAIADFLADDGAEAAGRVLVRERKDGSRRFQVQSVAALGTGWQLPTLHLDATPDVELLRLRFGSVELAADIRAAAPFMRATLVTGKAFGKGALVGADEMSEEDRKAVPRLQDAVRRDILGRIAGRPGKYLVVTHEALARQWKAVMPTSVEVAHFGGLRGLNRHSGVAGVFIVGRWGLPPGGAENMAAALTGCGVARVAGWFPAQAVTLGGADGSLTSVDVDAHPDEIAERVRHATVVGELVQAIGRGRGVQRTADAPLQVVVYGNADLRQPLESVELWEPPGVDARTLAEHGWMLDAPGHTARLTGMKADAVRQRRHREAKSTPRYVTFPNKKTLSLDNVTHLLWQRTGLGYCQYQAEGAGQREQCGVFDLAQVGTPSREAIAAALGRLLGAAVRLTALHHHDADNVLGWGSCRLLVDRIAGHWNFGLVPANGTDWDAGVSDAPCGIIPTAEQGDCAVPDWLDELNEAIAADPETWGELVLQGAKAAGVSMTALREAVVAGAEACDILEADDEPDPRRLELYREIATGGLDLVHRLAMIGAGVAIPERREPCHA